MAKAKPTAPASIRTMLFDPSVPFEHRRRLLAHVCTEENPECAAMVESILQAAATGSQDERKEAMIQKLNEMIQAMEAGPLRYATFLKLLPPRNGVTRAHVALQDGTSAYTVLAEEALAESLHCGDTVVLEAQARALLFHDPDRPDTGEEARLERRVDHERVQVSLRDHDRFIFRASDLLIEKLDSGDVTPGSSLLVCPRRFLAFDGLPKQDGLSHYRYLAKDPVPNVVIERDIGSPPAFLEELAEHVRMEMLTPELARRYRLRRAVMKMLTGVSGSGKTLCIQGFWRRLYEIMAEVTGASLDQLPQRVLRLRMAQVLSKWLGDSDKQLDRFFDEVDEIADKTFTAPNGEVFELPVLVICEEADGLARTRGEEAIYDRIQTTLLQRLDVTCQKLGDKLVIFLFTTNVPHLVDPAFLRRAGGTTERFGRLTKKSFQSVLAKHLRGLPLAGANGDAEIVRREVIADVAAWFFSPNGSDAGQVELLYAGSTTPDVRYRRDFLTGALVDRAVQQASAEACREERLGADEPGVTANLLIRTFDRQVRSIVDQLHRDNVVNYVALPEGARVANVRRLEQPTVLPFELERIA